MLFWLTLLVWLLLFSPDLSLKSSCLAARLRSAVVFELSKEVIVVRSVKACDSLNSHISLPSMFALIHLEEMSAQGYTCERRGGDVIRLELSTSLLTRRTIRRYSVVRPPLPKTCVHLYRETSPTWACAKLLCC